MDTKKQPLKSYPEMDEDPPSKNRPSIEDFQNEQRNRLKAAIPDLWPFLDRKDTERRLWENIGELGG